jgi:hypothetical protein
MISKKRGLESSTSDMPSSNSTTFDNKKPKVSNLSNFNIIDVISSEYFNDEETNKVNEKETTAAYKSKPAEKITCNGKELIREKTEIATKPEYIYDLYYTKSEDIHLDLLYPNNYEIKSFNNYRDVDLVDDNDDDDDYNGLLFSVCNIP